MNKITTGIIFVCISVAANGQAAEGTVMAQNAVQSADGDKPAMEQPDKSLARTNCITQTGSRLKSRDKNGCNGLPGRSYTKADLELTGATTLAEALQRLDPSVQFGR